MKSIIFITLIACTLTFVATQDHAYGGFEEAQFDKERHQQPYNAAVNYLTSKDIIAENSAPHLISFFQKAVSGIMYKFIIGAGDEVFEVQVLEQAWMSVLTVQGYRKVPHRI